MITKQQLMSFAPNTAAVSDDPYQDLVDAINATLDKFNIDTPRRIRYFMAQSFFETQGFTRFVENLNYTTPERLVAVWPARFTMSAGDASRAFAPDYAGNPEKLANLVYANRNGNGDAASGDGWSFRGRGGFHLTFRGNYVRCSQDTYGDDRLVQNPDLVMAFPAAMASAGWFWNLHGFNDLADSDSLTKVTEIINGSAATVPERKVVLDKANLIF